MSKLIKKYFLFVIALMSMSSFYNKLYTFSINSPLGHDPYPRYSTLDPHEFLCRTKRERLKGFLENENQKNERFQISITPFAQYSNRGRNIHNEKVFLGDLPDRWGMIALLFGDTPEDEELGPILSEAKTALFPNETIINDQRYIDSKQKFGFFSTPLKYRRYGVRFDFSVLLAKGFGISAKFGFSDICQTLENICDHADICPAGSAIANVVPIDLTDASTSLPSQTPPDQISGQDVKTYLMDRLDQIAGEICLDLSDFNKCSGEDIHLDLFWRRPIDVNPDPEFYPDFLVIPYFVLRFTGASGDIKNPSCAYALPFGNDGHHALGFKAGLNLDFSETIEVGGEAGFTHFFSREFNNFRVPNSRFQTGIYPFSTRVKRHPGANCHVGLKLSAYHFLGNLSFYFQYVAVIHKKDHIELCKHDPAFKPCVLEAVSDWKSQIANIGFNYDISPNISLGFLWQAPLSQKRAYRSSTVMLGFNALY